MVLITRQREYPEEYARQGIYRLEREGDEWAVYLDPPADPLGPPIAEALDPPEQRN